MLEFLHVFPLPLPAQKLFPSGEQIFDGNDIVVGMTEKNTPRVPPPRILPLLERIKSAYILWHEYHSTLPKTHRYSLGNRVDDLFIESMEAVFAAAFLGRDEKLPYVRLAARKIDALKLLLMILWETKSLESKKYAALSERMDEIGKMLGGWQGQIKKNSPGVEPGEKRRE